MDHSLFMRRAIELTSNAPELPFGAVLVDVKTGEVVAEGWNRSAENPTWHGEVDVINRHASDHGEGNWSDLFLYTTAEPCPMCAGAIIWAGISTVVYGTSIPTLIKQGWFQIKIRASEVVVRTPNSSLQVIGGILEEECDELFAEAMK